MAIAFVQKQVKNGTATPAAAPAFASSVAVGDLIVVMIGVDDGLTGTVTGVTDSLGNTYSAVPSFETASSGTLITLGCYYARVTVAGASNVVSVAFNDVSASINFAVQHFNGFTGTVTFDKKNTSINASSTTATSGATATTTQATELVIGGAIHSGTVSAYTLGSGYTNLSDSSVAGRQLGMESKVVAATGAQTATFTIALARANIGGVVTFYNASSGTLFTSSLSGALSFTGGIKFQTTKKLTGALSFTGNIQKAISRKLTATLSFVGTLKKRLARSFSGTLSFSGALSSGRIFTKALSGVLSFTAALTTSRVARVALTAVLSFTGSFSKRTTKKLTGTLSFTGVLKKAILRTLTATLSFTGNMVKSIRRAFTASLSFIATFRGVLPSHFTPLTTIISSLTNRSNVIDQTNIASAASNATIESVQGTQNTSTTESKTNTTTVESSDMEKTVD